MKKGDFIWAAALVAVAAFLAVPVTHGIFIKFTSSHPYMSGFIKFLILATMGELLANRINEGKWTKPAGIGYRAVLWGIFGMIISLFFQIYASGVSFCMSNGYLPGNGSKLAFAFQTSLLNNVFFAPVFMSIHKITDTYIDLKVKEKREKVSLNDVLQAADWKGFVNFVLLKTVPFFWIPMHTITFLLPPEYRLIMAATLSIALGAMLASAKKGSAKLKAA